jgi:hypothetical protein
MAPVARVAICFNGAEFNATAVLKAGTIDQYVVTFNVPPLAHGVYEVNVATGTGANLCKPGVNPTAEISNSTWLMMNQAAVPSNQPLPGCGQIPLGPRGPVLPEGAQLLSDDEIPPTSTGLVHNLYPNENTMTDLWYQNRDVDSEGCPFSIGGGPVPSEPVWELDIGNYGVLGETLDRVGEAIVPKVQQILEPNLPQIVPPGFFNQYPWKDKGICQSAPVAAGKGFCEQLQRGAFSGKDIIFVHGFSLDTAMNMLDNPTNTNPKTRPEWPGDKCGFDPNPLSIDPNCKWTTANTFNFHSRATEYWVGAKSHVDRFLKNKGYKNRYMVVGWSTAQRLPFAAHATLTQIVEAITTGKRVVKTDPNDWRGTNGFCSDGCVIVSHSTGGLVSDVAFGRTLDPAFISTWGDLRFLTQPRGALPPLVTTHVAAGSAVGGSRLVTATVAVTAAINLPIPEMQSLCKVASVFIAKGDKTANKFGSGLQCFALMAVMSRSVFLDLVPLVTRSMWAPTVRRTPVPTLMVAGGNHESLLPMKYFLQPGFDDGVVNMDSACAREVNPVFWPWGFRTGVPPLSDVRLFDRGMAKTYPAVAGVLFYEQNAEHVFSTQANRFIGRAAAACTPFKTPHGMVEPKIRKWIFRGARPDPTVNYGAMRNHYSFLVSGENHGASDRPISKVDGLIYGEPWWTSSSTKAFYDVRAILNPQIYAFLRPDATGKTLQTMQEEFMEGRVIRFKFMGHTYKRYVWKRTYHVLEGWGAEASMDYAYRFVK